MDSNVPVATRSFREKHQALYASERDCARYEADLCQRQDHHNTIVDAIRELVPLCSRSTSVADVGAGTGKLAKRLAPHVASVVVCDRSTEALAVARSTMGDASCSVSFHQADLRALPMADGSVDVVVAGWAISYLKSEHEEWYADGSSGGPWRREVDTALSEMDRVLAPGGLLAVLETLGTATDTPQRSGSWLYAHLREAGLAQRVLRTDYRFPDRPTAMSTLLFFFGKGVVRRAEALLSVGETADAPCIVPECTGLWWRRKPGEAAGPRAPVPPAEAEPLAAEPSEPAREPASASKRPRDEDAEGRLSNLSNLQVRSRLADDVSLL